MVGSIRLYAGQETTFPFCVPQHLVYVYLFKPTLGLIDSLAFLPTSHHCSRESRRDRAIIARTSCVASHHTPAQRDSGKNATSPFLVSQIPREHENSVGTRPTRTPPYPGKASKSPDVACQAHAQKRDHEQWWVPASKDDAYHNLIADPCKRTKTRLSKSSMGVQVLRRSIRGLQCVQKETPRSRRVRGQRSVFIE